MEDDRPLAPAILNGVRLRCPCCGQGPLMRSYLKTRDRCAVCSEALHHHRADDGPAYLTILVVGKLMAVALLALFVAFRPDPFVLAAGLGLGSVALSLFLLPRFKGLFVAIQWAKRMHGFGDDHAAADPVAAE